VSRHKDVLKVLVADGQPIFLDGLRRYLGHAADLAVVATAMTEAAAIACAREHGPDVVLLNVELLGAARAIVTDAPAVAVLVVSDLDKEEHLGVAMAAGAAGYVTKNAEPEDILTAIRVTARGGFFTDAAVAPRVRRALSGPSAAFPQLTAREREVLELLAQDTGVNAIAGSLGVTSKTVGRHVSSICLKLPARSRAEAVRMARAARL
jgi:DNA-binding NarL/FixJ family response regulator